MEDRHNKKLKSKSNNQVNQESKNQSNADAKNKRKNNNEDQESYKIEVKISNYSARGIQERGKGANNKYLTFMNAEESNNKGMTAVQNIEKMIQEGEEHNRTKQRLTWVIRKLKFKSQKKQMTIIS